MFDLNTTAKSDAVVDVKNSTVSEPAKADITGNDYVQNTSNSKEIGTNTNSTNLQPGNSQELVNTKAKSIKAQVWAVIFPNGEDMHGISSLLLGDT